MVILQNVDGTFSADNEAISTAVWNRSSLSNNISGSMGWIQNKSILMAQSIDKIRGMTCGRWTINGSQMIFYDENNSDEITRFNLFDGDGLPFFAEQGSPAERRVV